MCSNPDRLETKRWKMGKFQSEGLDIGQMSTARSSLLPSYLPAKAPHLRTRGREGRRARCGAPCTPALIWSHAHPTA